MKKYPFSEKELEVVKTIPSPWPGDPDIRVYDRPCSDYENYRSLYYDKCAVWEPTFDDGELLCPKCVPDNISRGFVLGGEDFDLNNESGGPDMFGIEWEYVPSAGGSMVRPGSPLMEDANDWKKLIKFPDIDKWDWQGSAEANKNLADGKKWVTFTLLTGAWFERLISFMDFDGAVMALIDEDQQDAVKELFEATTDLNIRIIDKALQYFPYINSICIHDDWGSQAQPFFSEATLREMIMPYAKKIVDHIHSKGRIADLHSCGHIESRIEDIIEMGWDSWTPQNMNDAEKLYEEYGDKIVFGAALNEEITPETSPEEEIRLAKEFASKFCKPGKPTIAGYYFGSYAFSESLYKYSRLAYLGE